MSEEEVKTILGDEKTYYEALAKAFSLDLNDELLKTNPLQFFQTNQWIYNDKRNKIKNVWAVITDILRKISLDKEMTGNVNNEYDRISFNHLILFSSLLGMKKRVVSNSQKVAAQGVDVMKMFHMDVNTFSKSLEYISFQKSIFINY